MHLRADKIRSFLVASLVTSLAATLASSCSDDRRGGNNNANPDGGMSMCTGLQCFQMECTDGTPTTLTGKVHAPNGLDPMYDALVYVPTVLPAFPDTIQCEACNEPLGGAPLVSTKTAVDGSFTLTNVPATMEVPLVVQKGRFRRVISLNVSPCTSTALPKEQTRLPKNQQEGDLPRIAVGIGNYDQIECVLHSIGIDESEFTPPSGTGSVHLYKNYDGSSGGDQLSSLLSNYDQMAKYNLMFVNCTGTRAQDQPAGWKANLYKYVNSGGRLYVTDWAYDYMEQVPEFAPYINFDAMTETTPEVPEVAFYANPGTDVQGTIVDPILKEWMIAAGATTNGNITIEGSWALADHVSASPDHQATVWVESAAVGQKRPYTATVDYNMCGKILWSSYHTQEPGGGGFDTDPNGAFPSYCASTPSTMIPQEKILEFLIFQISDCVVPII